MAKQKGIIKLKGTIGDISFYKTQDGYLAREKGGVDASRIANDPRFQRTRENGAEFGRAGKAGRTMRMAFRSLLQQSADGRVASRMTQECMRVIQTDIVHPRGQRLVANGEVGFLEGFDFNIQGKLSRTFFAPFTVAIDRAAGSLKIDIPSFIPEEAVTFPAGATHYKIISGGAAIDFEQEDFESDLKATGMLPLDNNATAELNIDHLVTTNTPVPLFVVLGIVFYQQVNGQFYLLKNAPYNPLSIVKTDALA